jgi:hypothetical protein
MSGGFLTVVVAASLAMILSVVQIARNDRLGWKLRGFLIAAAVALAGVTVVGGYIAAKKSQSLQDAVDKIATNQGNQEALSNVVEAARNLSDKVARGSAEDIVDLQARQLPDARAARDADYPWRAQLAYEPGPNAGATEDPLLLEFYQPGKSTPTSRADPLWRRFSGGEFEGL